MDLLILLKFQTSHKIKWWGNDILNLKGQLLCDIIMFCCNTLLAIIQRRNSWTGWKIATTFHIFSSDTELGTKNAKCAGNMQGWGCVKCSSPPALRFKRFWTSCDCSSSSSLLCKNSLEGKTTPFPLGIIQWKLITPFLLKISIKFHKVFSTITALYKVHDLKTCAATKNASPLFSYWSALAFGWMVCVTLLPH